MEWMVLLETTFPGQAQTKAVHQYSERTSFAWGHKHPMYFARPQKAGPTIPIVYKFGLLTD